MKVPVALFHWYLLVHLVFSTICDFENSLLCNALFFNNIIKKCTLYKYCKGRKKSKTVCIVVANRILIHLKDFQTLNLNIEMYSFCSSIWRPLMSTQNDKNAIAQIFFYLILKFFDFNQFF